MTLPECPSTRTSYLLPSFPSLIQISLVQLICEKHLRSVLHDDRGAPAPWNFYILPLIYVKKFKITFKIIALYHVNILTYQLNSVISTIPLFNMYICYHCHKKGQIVKHLFIIIIFIIY